MEHGADTSTVSEVDTDAADRAAIARTVAAAERHQNDVDPFLALHTTDTTIVNIAGRRVAGREAFGDAMRAALDSSLAQVLTRTEIEDIRFVRPDVAIVSCLKHVSDQRDPATRGEAENLPLAGRLSYVVVKDQDVWRIALAQTTPIRT